MNDLKELMKKRRSRYDLAPRSPISDEQIKELVDTAVLHVPSGYNSQSTRLVLLLGDHHRRLWEIVKEELAKIVAPEKFPRTEAKIDGSFASGYGTILFYEDQAVVRSLQEKFPSYVDKFPQWSEHTSAMHQYALWLMLTDAGMGASLQHYNPVIDGSVARQWNIDPEWRLISQMVFGETTGEPGSKEFQPLEGRSLVFK